MLRLKLFRFFLFILLEIYLNCSSSAFLSITCLIFPVLVRKTLITVSIIISSVVGIVIAVGIAVLADAPLGGSNVSLHCF